MTITEILSSDELLFPMEIDEGNLHSIIDFLQSKFNSIIEKIKELNIDNNKLTSKKQDSLQRDFVDNLSSLPNLREFGDGIIHTVELYFSGDIFEAYKCFDETLKRESDRLIISALEKIDSNHFYRVRSRVKDDLLPIDKWSMFHIPLDQRNMVSVDRFSITGLPTLYLGNSLYVCWKELNEPKEMSVSIFKTSKKLRVLNLAVWPKLLVEIIDSNNNKVINYFFVLFLMIACSIKSNDRKKPFKPEYIIPQLLMWWVRKSNFDGIQYISCMANQKNYRSELIFEHGTIYPPLLCNYAFPIKDVNMIINGKYNKQLADIFEWSEPIEWMNIRTEINRFIRNYRQIKKDRLTPDQLLSFERNSD